MTINDIELWAKFKDGDRDALAAIYQKYAHSLIGYGCRLVRDEDIVKDALQDTFVKLWTNRKNVGQASNIKYFLISAFRNNLNTLYSKSNKMPIVDLEEARHFEMDFTPESAHIKTEESILQSQKLSNALNQLSARQKEIIYLRYFEELDYKEISSMMNISVKGAYKLSARALEALQEILGLSSKASTIMALLLFYK